MRHSEHSPHANFVALCRHGASFASGGPECWLLKQGSLCAGRFTAMCVPDCRLTACALPSPAPLYFAARLGSASALMGSWVCLCPCLLPPPLPTLHWLGQPLFSCLSAQLTRSVLTHSPLWVSVTGQGPACAHMNSQSLKCTSLHSSPEALLNCTWFWQPPVSAGIVDSHRHLQRGSRQRCARWRFDR